MSLDQYLDRQWVSAQSRAADLRRIIYSARERGWNDSTNLATAFSDSCTAANLISPELDTVSSRLLEMIRAEQRELRRRKAEQNRFNEYIPKQLPTWQPAAPYLACKQSGVVVGHQCPNCQAVMRCARRIREECVPDAKVALFTPLPPPRKHVKRPSEPWRPPVTPRGKRRSEDENSEKPKAWGARASTRGRSTQ
jgi:hypothetical protein